MIKELDNVVLKHDINKYGLKNGDIGTVVHCYSDGKAFEVEFVTAEGTTLAILTLDFSSIRTATNREVLHVRMLDATGKSV